ncbi:glycosyl transferase [Ottowia beijingensis]|uniref:glycosyl transferase n=1 Tax=Ottowia beijingensis TaxID=1207057 RepID=UPI002FDB3584
MQITASLVSHGHADEVAALLAQMAALGGLRPRRVILTLNLPAPALASAVRARDWPFALELVVNDVPVGFGTNHNRAFARDRVLGGSDAFAVINPDIRLLGNPFIPMVEVFRSRPAAGCVYPRQIDRHGRQQDSERLLPTLRRLLRRHVGGRRHEVADGARPDWVNAAFLLLRRQAYAEVQGFDERYHMYCEDVDLCLRLQLRGWQLLRADAAVVEHRAERASHRLLSHLGWHLRSLARLWRSSAYRDYRALHRP